MILWAFDPGDITGWALYVDDYIQQFGQADGLKELLYIISTLPAPDVIVVEDYKIRPNVNHTYSRVNTIQIIGALKAKALELGAQYVLQDASVKPIAYKWSGLTQPKNHSASHEFDAMAHGYYYLVKNKRRQPILIERMEKDHAKEN